MNASVSAAEWLGSDKMPRSNGGEHRPADDAVRTKPPQAVERIIEVYPLHLPVEQQPGIRQKDEIVGMEMSGDARRQPHRHGGAVEREEERRCLVAERQR